MEQDIYRITGPTTWATAPDMYSFSSLQNILECPLRWQLQKSEYGELKGFPSRPHEKTVTGTIIHEVLDQLFKTLVIAKLPALGSASFQQVIQQFDPLGKISDHIRLAQKSFQAHLRGAGRQIKATPRELHNQLIQIFRPQYTEAQQRRQDILCPEETKKQGIPSAHSMNLFQRLQHNGVLTEEYLVHPALPLHGYADLIRYNNGHPVIIDFKTGQFKEAHQKQVALYALLFYRMTGVLPGRCQVVYPEEAKSYSIDKKFLEQLEQEVNLEIQSIQQMMAYPPALAHRGDYCCYCDVRQFCEDYWQHIGNAWSKEKPWGDLEFQVRERISISGYKGKMRNHVEVSMVFHEQLANFFDEFASGEWLRILMGRLQQDDTTQEKAQHLVVELDRTTEVFFTKSRFYGRTAEGHTQ